jgi:hypothetical protein
MRGCQADTPPGNGQQVFRRSASRRGVPHREQVRVFLVQFVLEPAKGAFALDSATEPAPGMVIADALGEAGQVLRSTRAALRSGAYVMA